MTKQLLPPTALLHPLPVVLLSSQDAQGGNNIITLAWVGMLCSRPPMLAVGLRPATHSHGIIVQSQEFVINVPAEDHLEAIKLCGSRSGRDIDKFSACGFTPVPGSKVRAPLIQECAVNLECVVRHVVNAGSHDVFMGEVVAVQVSTDKADERGWPDPAKHRPVMLNLGAYYGLGPLLSPR